MALVILIIDKDTYQSSDTIEQDMRRWWRDHCVKYIMDNGDIIFDVGRPKRYNLYEGVKRLSSFGVSAKIVRHTISHQL